MARPTAIARPGAARGAGAGGQGSVVANTDGARTTTKPLAGPVRVRSKVFAVGCVEPPASEVVEVGPLVHQGWTGPDGLDGSPVS